MSEGKKPRILLVEDDLGLAAAYRTRMEAEGFDVHHCPNGEEAMQQALEYHPDLILLDIMMPKISGFDVLDILRNTKETKHTKIIILTALSQPSDKQRAKDLGADEFLVKSQAVIADVMKRIRFHLGLKQPAGAES
jgi:DNA-binding response OmpR family regulator